MMHPSYGPPLLYITCYLDDFVPTVGEQYVLINFEYSNDCVSNGIASTAMATESSPPPSTNHGMQTSHVVAPSSSESSLSPSTTHDMQTNHAVASSSTGVSDSVALALVLTFTGLAALIVTCIGLNYVVAKTKRPTGQSV